MPEHSKQSIWTEFLNVDKLHVYFKTKVGSIENEEN